jgi:hypothetical protein
VGQNARRHSRTLICRVQTIHQGKREIAENVYTVVGRARVRAAILLICGEGYL